MYVCVSREQRKYKFVENWGAFVRRVEEAK